MPIYLQKSLLYLFRVGIVGIVPGTKPMIREFRVLYDLFLYSADDGSV